MCLNHNSNINIRSTFFDRAHVLVQESAELQRGAAQPVPGVHDPGGGARHEEPRHLLQLPSHRQPCPLPGPGQQQQQQPGPTTTASRLAAAQFTQTRGDISLNTLVLE
jgi:hypothetical protein